MSEPDDLTWRIRNRISFDEMIYNVSPSVTPFASVRRSALVRKRKTGGSMRQRRRSIMKPLRFTPQPKVARIHEWRVDK